MLNNKYGFNLTVFIASIIAFQPCFSAQSTVKKHTVWKDQIEKKEHWLSMNWRPVFTFSAGAAVSNTVGNSKFTPIIDPIEDQFFAYNVGNSNQTQFIYGLFLGMELLLEPGWYLQTGFSYYQPMDFHVQGLVTQGADVQSQNSFTYRYIIQPHQVLFENKLLYKWIFHSKSFLPYLSAGIGVGSNSTRDYTVNITPEFTTFSNQFSNETTTSFAYRVGLGIDYDINNWIRVGLGYRCTDFGAVKLGNAAIDQVPTFNNLSQAHFYTNEVLGQLTFVI